MNRLSRIVSLSKYATARCNSSGVSQPDAVDLREDRFDDLKHMEARAERRKPAVKPLMKTMMLGEVDGTMLAYHEVLNKSELDEMNRRVSFIEECAADAKLTDADLVKRFNEVRLFGAPAALLNGGYSANVTERCKYLEPLGARVAVAKRLKNQWNGIDFIKCGFQPDDVNKFISPLVSGDAFVNILYHERLSEDPGSPDIRCYAEPSAIDEWVVNGEKIFQGDRRDDNFFVTLCKGFHNQPEFFLIFPKAAGVTVQDSLIKFRNTPCVRVGKPFDEKNVEESTLFFDRCMGNTRLETAVLSLSILKSGIREFVANTRQKYVGGKPYCQSPMLENAVAEAVISAYALESMIYYTAGLADGFESPDVIIEATLCKVYASTCAYHALTKMASAVSLYDLPPQLARLMDDAKVLYLSEEHNDRLSIYAALCGVQHAGRHLAETVKKARDPFTFPSFVIKTMMANRHQIADDPPLKLYLHEHLHLSLQDSAKKLEYCIMRLKYAVEILLNRHGVKVVEEERSLKRLSEIMTQVYAAFTSISRASRAYCIGLHMADNEIFVATYVVHFARDQVKQLVLDIENDLYLTFDNVREDISTKAFKHGGAYQQHALERVFY